MLIIFVLLDFNAVGLHRVPSSQASQENSSQRNFVLLMLYKNDKDPCLLQENVVTPVS